MASSTPSQTPRLKDGIAHVPLWGADGRVRAWALVDESSLPAVVTHRWRLGTGSNAITNVRGPSGEVRVLSMQRAVLGLPPSGTPKVGHRNSNPLDNRRSNLVLSKAGLARALEAAPEIRDLLLSREVERAMMSSEAAR